MLSYVQTLLGTYQCTEVAGEFVWQAGSLTRAVINGHWVLLEDLDYAPMDVISLLVPLLESRTLSLPGHGGNIKAHANFRIFATQRFATSANLNNKFSYVIIHHCVLTALYVLVLSKTNVVV